MRLFVPGILIFFYIQLNAQTVPPVIQWQKCFGGTMTDVGRCMRLTPDGGFIMAGNSNSNNGDVTNNHGAGDIWCVKFDAMGIIQWQKCLGGSLADAANDIESTADGGYIIVGTIFSPDGDVSGFHGQQDIWVVKLSAGGAIQWQKCLGGSGLDNGFSISLLSNGGYVVGGNTNSNDGDVNGLHGSINSDGWLVVLDGLGNIQWQKCLGGSLGDEINKAQQTPDGGFIVLATTRSIDGDVSGNHALDDTWLIKLDGSGNIQWQKCFGGSSKDLAASMVQSNNGYTLAINTSSNDGDVTGNHSSLADIWIVQVNGSGNILWQKCFGGSDADAPGEIMATIDGGYVIAGTSYSYDGDACKNNGESDIWVLKLDPAGNLEWQKSLGGSDKELAYGVAQTTDGGYFVAGQTLSNDKDVSHSNGSFEYWVAKLSFPGIPLNAGITISSNTSVICPGQNIIFTASPVNGGSHPSYQWRINGTNVLTDSSIFNTSSLVNGDVVSCVMTSNLSCINTPVAISNSITRTVDPSLVPSNFLPPDTSMCIYGTIELKPLNNYASYLWSTNDTTTVITISRPDKYWLRVTDSNSCGGMDSIIVNPKDCLQGFYVPSAFTPNNDGKNDVFMPLLFGNVKHYKFSVYNRWGQIVFHSTELNKGWDGTLSGRKANSNVYIWTCTYQLEGEKIKTVKGTVAIVK